MKNLFKFVRNDKIILRSSIATIITVIIAVLFSTFYYSSLPPVIPLFNQLPWGEERLANSFFIFLPPAVAILILSINIIFAEIIYDKAPLIARMLVITSFLIGVFSLLLVIRTATIIT